MLSFSVDRDLFSATLAKVAQACPAKSTMPVLTTVALGTGNPPSGVNFVWMSCTDLDIALSASVAVETVSSGDVCVNARDLLKVIKSLPAGNVEITADARHFITIKAGKAKFTMPGVSADEFPKIGGALLGLKGDTQDLFVLPAVLSRGLAVTTPCVSIDETRYVLNGVLFDGANRVMVATDGHRLVKTELPLVAPMGQEFKPIIIPRKACGVIARLLADNTENIVGLEFSDTHVRAEIDGVTLVTRLIEGRFPDFTQVIPKGDGANHVKMPLADLMDMVKRISMVLDGRSNGVRLDATGVSAHGHDKGEASEAWPDTGTVEVKDAVGVNAGYLADALRLSQGAEDAQVDVRWHDALSPLTVQCGVGPLHVVMPMRL